MTLLPRAWIAAAAALLLCVTLWLPAAALADAGRYLSSDAFAELSRELEGLQTARGSGSAPQATPDRQRRLADLQALRSAVADSDDRSQVTNGSGHSLGVFARYKKDPATSPARFYVLGPGHATDDDYEVVGLFVPAGVTLRWGEDGGTKAAASPRLARILEGQQLEVSDLPVPAEAEAAAPADAPVSYGLSLPVFAVEASRDNVAALPSLSQAQLDQELETAPLD